MVSLDVTVVNVALPNLKRELHADVTALQWVVDGYTLIFAALLLSAGALGDRNGPKKVFQAGLLLFSLASTACGLASTALALVLGRVAQGFGAALLVSTSLALLQAVYTDRAARARAFGVWAGVGGVAVAAGPVIGGFLVDAFSWRAVFFINIPFGLLGLIVAAKYIPSLSGHRRRLDMLGQSVGVIALGGITVAFIEVGSRGWRDPVVLTVLLTALVAAAVFVAVESRVANAMLPLALFRNRTFFVSNLVGFLINFSFYGQLFLVTLYFQEFRGYSAMSTGLALLPQALMTCFAAFASGRVAARTGSRLPMMVGSVAGAVGLGSWWMIGSNSTYLLMVGPLIITGFGPAFMAPAATAAVMAATSTNQGGISSGVINAARQTGSVMGVAVLGSLVSHNDSFIPSLHVALMLAAAAFLAAFVLTAIGVERGRA
jgi:DHA2 family methylenomycin A resistance protein-like MFS transporter